MAGRYEMPYTDVVAALGSRVIAASIEKLVDDAGDDGDAGVMTHVAYGLVMGGREMKEGETQRGLLS